MRPDDSKGPTLWLADRLAEEEPIRKRPWRRGGQLSIGQLMVAVATVAALFAIRAFPGDALRAFQEFTAGEDHDAYYKSKHSYMKISYSRSIEEIDRRIASGPIDAGETIRIADKDYPATNDVRKYFYKMMQYHESEITAHENGARYAIPHLCRDEPVGP